MWIMSKAWSEKHKVTRPLDFKNKEESLHVANANGTGPYMLVSRAARHQDHATSATRPGGASSKATCRRSSTRRSPTTPRAWPRWSPARSTSCSTRRRATSQRLRSTDGVKILDGPENRVIFLGMDQCRDELLYSSVKGKNPFKDLRVRQALYQAIDIETHARPS